MSDGGAAGIGAVGSGERGSSVAIAGLALAIGLGAVFRLIFPGDIAFGPDAAELYAQAVGPGSGSGTSFPGFAVWLFRGLAWIGGVMSPPDLARMAALCSIAALVVASFIALRLVPPGQSRVWLWAVALWAVNPMAVIFERRIAPQSLLPLLTILLIVAWFRRERPWGSALFGLLTVLMALVQPSTILLGGAIMLWTLVARRGTFQALYLVAGAVFGTIATLPLTLGSWSSGRGVVAHPFADGWGWPKFHTFTRWFTQPFGFGTETVLGARDLVAFMAQPVVLGQHLFLVAAIHALLVGLAVMTWWRVAIRLRRGALPSARMVLVGLDETGLLVRAGLIGYGLALTLLTSIGVISRRTDLIVALPLMSLWLARMIEAGGRPGAQQYSPRLVVTLVVLQALTTASLLGYIHTVKAVRGNYGATWSAQQQQPGLAPSTQTP